MNVLLNEHTFLVISFVLAGWALYKFAYKKLDKQVEKTIDEVKETIINNEKARQNAEFEIKNFQTEINKLTEKAKEEEAKAKLEAERKSENNNENIARIVTKKQQEYENEKLKIENSFVSKATNNYIRIVTQKLKSELKQNIENVEFQAKAVENSLNMVEEYIAKIDER